MRRAIELADAAAEHGDVPIGAVLVLADGRAIESCNEKELRRDATAHAEMLAHVKVITDDDRDAIRIVCRVKAVRDGDGCRDPKGGAAGSVIDLVNHPALNHRIAVRGGVLEAETARQLQAFFAAKRARPRAGDGESERDIR